MAEKEEYQKSLYQKDSKGRVKVWVVEVLPYAPESEFAIIRVESGLQGGKLVTTDTRIVIGKNIGKANETTPWQQAVAEAKAKAEKKEKEGYVDDINNIKESHVLGSGTEEPMLAERYDPKGEKKKSRDLDKLKLRGKSVGVQRKKDGNRANPAFKFNPETGRGELQGYLSRKGNPYPYDFPQITKVLEDAYMNHPELYGKDFTLDGELFTSELSFNELNGILKKKTLTKEYMELLETVEFHLYDIYSPEHYERRIQLFTPFGQPEVLPNEVDERKVKAIETYIVEAQEDILEKWLNKFLEEGEEGLMIRVLDQPYIHKRTWNLLKYTITERQEFEIVDLALNKHGRLDKFIMKALLGATDRNGDPISTFKVGTRHSRAELAKILEEKEQYIGEMAVVEHKGLSEYLVPRCGKFHGLRADYTEPTEEEDED